jgi:hypothetical protein
MKSLLIILLFACALQAGEYSYWIEACPAVAGATHLTGCEPGDPELARWALEAWQRESGGAIVLKKSATEESARLRIHWATGATSLYGETEPIMVGGKRGGIVYVLPSVGPERTDPVMRDAIVYLTCLHETGHALGLAHTRNFADIMYSFQYGGDISAYFHRYRDLLKTRADIPAHAGVSDADRVALRAALKQ